MINKALFFAAGLLASICGPVLASPGFYTKAVQIGVDNQWHSFDVDELLENASGLHWINLDGQTMGFEFTLTEAAYLTVVDGGFAGDRFSVFDNGVLLGQTSQPVNNYPDSVAMDFDAAMADAGYSLAVYLLNPGQHGIYGLLDLSAIDDMQTALNATVGAVRLTAVPLPAAFWLFSAGLALTGVMSRRKQIA